MMKKRFNTFEDEVDDEKKIENHYHKITFVTGVSFKVEVTELVDFTWKIFYTFEDEIDDEKKI